VEQNLNLDSDAKKNLTFVFPIVNSNAQTTEIDLKAVDNIAMCH